MNMRRIIAALALLFVVAPALAQTTNPWPRFIPVRPDGSVIDPGSVGGGSGGSVSQGTSPWVISGNSTANGSTNPIFVQITNFPGTQAISAASLPLPTGAATAALQSNVQSAAGTSASTLLTVQGSSSGVAIPVTGTFFQATQPVSSTTLATAANQNSTAAGTSATSAQAVQGVTGGVALPISASALPLPTGAATAANQSSEISALGATGDTAYAGSGTASIIAGLKGVYNATLAPLATGTNTIGSIANISGTVSLPTGAATSANQSTEITALNTIATRAAFFSEFSTATTASQTVIGAVHDLGTASPYSRISAGGNSTQQGTFNLLGCYDSACSGTFTLATQAVGAGGGSAAISYPAVTRWWRVQFVNSTTAGAVNASSSATAN